MLFSIFIYILYIVYINFLPKILGIQLNTHASILGPPLVMTAQGASGVRGKKRDRRQRRRHAGEVDTEDERRTEGESGAAGFFRK